MVLNCSICELSGFSRLRRTAEAARSRDHRLVKTHAERQRERNSEKREQQRGPNDERARLAALEQVVATRAGHTSRSIDIKLL